MIAKEDRFFATDEFVCQDCRWRVKRKALGTCDLCGGKMSAAFLGGKLNISVFTPYVEHNITEQPLLIESKHQLGEECKRYGVRSTALM